MIERKIKYDDFLGNPREEVFRFNLTEAEVTEWQLSKSGGLSVVLERLMSEQDHVQIIAMFKEVIKKAYGVMSDDGKHFKKSKEIWEDFESTNAFNELYMELASDSAKGAEFIKGLVPAKLRTRFNEEYTKRYGTN